MAGAAQQLDQERENYEVEVDPIFMEGLTKPAASVINAMAVSAFRQGEGDRVKARSLLENSILEATKKDRELLAAVIKQWARVAIGNVIHRGRGTLTRESKEQSPELTRGLVTFANQLKQSWLNSFYTETGKVLGDCTKEDLVKEISLYRQRASENAVKARWLQALSDKVGNGTVRNKFTDKQVDEMWRKEAMS